VISTKYAGEEGSPVLNDAIAKFVSGLIFGTEDGFERYCTMGVFDGGSLIAGVVYHNYYPENGVVELSAASISKRWLNQPVLHDMFSLPFDVLGCQLCVLRVSEKNTSMLRIASAYGFTDHRIPRLRGRNEAEHILTLTDDDWRENSVLATDGRTRRWAKVRRQKPQIQRKQQPHRLARILEPPLPTPG
jgi:hypothetical protein